MGGRRTRARLSATAIGVILSIVGAGMSSAPAPAQTAAQITGTVVDAVSRAPVSHAHVAALTTTDYTLAAAVVADGSGRYSLSGLGAGSYFLYLLDPTGRHVPGFHGTPNPAAVVVATTGTTNADPTMAPRTGRLAGTVTEDVSRSPIAGAWALALSATTGRIESGVVADADGVFVIDGLSAGPHLVVVVDPTGAHLPEYHDGSPTPVGATPVNVVPGATTPVDAALLPASPPPPTTTIHGTITEAGSATALGGVWVVALDTATMTLRAGARTAADGTYSLDVAAGRYLLAFLDPSSSHAMEWYDDRDQTGLTSATPIDVAGATQVDEQLDRTTGELAGRVQEDESADPIAGAWVVAIGPTEVHATTTGADGSYRITGLAPGTYRAAFVDATDRRRVEYWNDGRDYASGQTFAVAAAQTTIVDDGLAPPRCGDPGAPAVCLPAFPTPLAGAGWSRYDIATGAHSATVTRGAQATTPKAGFSSASERRYHFVFDGTARYVLTNPTQPEDQLDWNKLPGLSDCGAIDLSQNGWMFAWRWRTDLTPQRLEITAYANDNGTHLWPNDPLVVLTSQQLDARMPLWFEMGISADRQRYEFRIAGPGSRSASATLPRQCAGSSTTTLKWASGFYFGGTSVAPSAIRGWINEP